MMQFVYIQSIVDGDVDVLDATMTRTSVADDFVEKTMMMMMT